MSVYVCVSVCVFAYARTCVRVHECVRERQRRGGKGGKEREGGRGRESVCVVLSHMGWLRLVGSIKL